MRPNAMLRLLPLLSVLGWLAACGSSDVEAPEVTAAAELAQSSSEVAAEEPAGASNSAPVIQRIRFQPEEPKPGDELRARVEASDADGDTVWFAYAWKVDGQPVGGDDAKLALEDVAKGQTVEVTVTPSDGKVEGDSSWSRVELGNRPPEIVGLTVEPGAEIYAGTPVVVRPNGRDLDGDGITYSYEWEVNGRSQSADGAQLETRRMRRGDEIRVRVVASDGQDEGTREAPLVRVVNAPPVFTSRPPQTLPEGEFRYRVVAEDPDGDPGLQYRLAEAPEGMRIEALSGEIAWVPAESQAGTHTVSVIADDLQGGQSQHSFVVNISAPDAVPASPAP